MVWQFLTKLSVVLPSDPAIVLLGIYSKELKTYVHTENLHMDVYNSLIHLPKLGNYQDVQQQVNG